NVYFNGAKPCDIEEGAAVDTEHRVQISLKEENGQYKVVTDYIQYLPKASMIRSELLGEAFEPEEGFENPDGSGIVFDTDLYGKKRIDNILAGPFAE
ncbi:MAG: hypothetical protein J6M27_00790, partial [Lachnospiraceae bacterium]|nr:hypothetical protein [Lachnospiraceae bacterium]